MNSDDLDRRELLKAATAAGLAVTAPTFSPKAFGAKSRRARTATGEENAKPGSRNWQLTRVRINQGDYRTSLIEGYCSHQSVAAGDALKVFVSTDPARRFTLDLFRMGYYGGAGARLMRRFGPYQSKPQRVPPKGEKRLRECRWEPSLEIK